MDRHFLDADHARKVHDALAPNLEYLDRLHQRLLEAGFPPADHLCVSVVQRRGGIGEC